MSLASRKVYNALRSKSGRMFDIPVWLDETLMIDKSASRYGWTEEYNLDLDIERVAALNGIMEGESKKQREDQMKIDAQSRKAKRRR